MQTAAQPRKFTFGQEFGSPDLGRKLEEARAEIARLRGEVEVAEARGRQAGFTEGRAHRDAEEAAKRAHALEQVARLVQQAVGTLARERQRVEAEGAELALATAKRIAGGLIEREPTAGVRDLVAQALSHLRNVPHLVVRVAPELVEEVDGELKRLAHERGFEGRLVILGDPGHGAGDCRVEWADGGITRDATRLNAMIDELVRGYVAARGG